MTDSKLPDNQAGYEKALTIAMAALSGGGFTLESAGMLSSLLGCSLESMVIDNDMLGNIRRIGRGIEVNKDTLSVDVIKSAVEGPGHFLGNEQTMALMKTEYLYPKQADRQSAQDWKDSGAKDSWIRAKETTRNVLENHWPVKISKDADEHIRQLFPIHLSPLWLDKQ